MAPPQNTWCDECFEAVNEGIDNPAPSVTVEQPPSNFPPSHPFSGGPAGSMPGFMDFVLGGPTKATCPYHPEGCPPYDPTKFHPCIGNEISDTIELTFA